MASRHTVDEGAPRVRSDAPFYVSFVTVSAAYVLLIVAMLVADATFTSFSDMRRVLASENVRFSIVLSLVSCTAAAVLSVLVAVPVGYLLSRHSFRGQSLVDGILDIPIVLPPLVIGLSLLILFQTRLGKGTESLFVAIIDALHVNDLLGAFGVRPIRGITYELPSVVLAQFSVACAFAVRTMRVAFDQIDGRREQVALTLGCTRWQAFRRVVLPEASPGVITAGTLAWARSMGEFGPILVFSGATPMKTEVLPTTVWLHLSTGDLEKAVAVSLLLVLLAITVLVTARVLGVRRSW